MLLGRLFIDWQRFTITSSSLAAVVADVTAVFEASILSKCPAASSWSSLVVRATETSVSSATRGAAAARRDVDRPASPSETGFCNLWKKRDSREQCVFGIIWNASDTILYKVCLVCTKKNSKNLASHKKDDNLMHFKARSIRNIFESDNNCIVLNIFTVSGYFFLSYKVLHFFSISTVYIPSGIVSFLSIFIIFGENAKRKHFLPRIWPVHISLQSCI